jgi:hypothetical protein
VHIKLDPFLDLSLSIPEKYSQRKNKLQEQQDPCSLEGN